MAGSSLTSRSSLRQLSPSKMLDIVRLRGFQSEAQLQAATRAFHRARGHSTGLDCRRFSDTFIRELSAAMPLELAQRLFTAWNRSAAGELTLDEFLDGVALLVNGSRDEHLRFVFELIKDGRALNKVGRDDTAAFLRLFGTPSTVIATFNQQAEETSLSIAQLCSSLHPLTSSLLTADEFAGFFDGEKWTTTESLVVVDWLRSIGDQLVSSFTVTEEASELVGSGLEASLETTHPSIRVWVFSRHEREAIRRELDALVQSPSCSDDVEDEAAREGYLRATKDSELVQAITGWTAYMQAFEGGQPSKSDGFEPLQPREQHKRFVLGLCCAQSRSAMQVYRSLFALFDRDNRGRLTESDLADFFLLSTPLFDRDDSERAAYEAMPSAALAYSPSPPPSPQRGGRPMSNARAIMTFMQFVNLVQQQDGFSAPEVEVALLLFHLHAITTSRSTIEEDKPSLTTLLREFRAMETAASDIHELPPSGFYLCEASSWHQVVKQICKLSSSTASELEATSRRTDTRELAQILNDAAEDMPAAHVLVPLSVWLTVCFWFTRVHSPGKSALDWRLWAMPTEMVGLLRVPRPQLVSIALNLSTDEAAWSRNACVPYGLVSTACSVQSVVDAACSCTGWKTTRPLTPSACSLKWLGMEDSGLAISPELLAMPLSDFLHSLPVHPKVDDEVSTLMLQVTMSDPSPSSSTLATEDVQLDDSTASARRSEEPWTTIQGLTNLGNTCFMNSALQALAATPLLREYFRQGEYQLEHSPPSPPHHKHLLSLKRDTTPPSLTQVFSELLQQMRGLSLASDHGPARAVTPLKMYSALGSLFPHMCDGSQQDAQEFISSFVSKLSDELKREPVQSQQAEESILSPQSRTILSRISTGLDAFPGSPSSGGVSRHDSHGIQKISPRDSNGRHDRIVAMEWWVSHLINEPSVITGFFSGQFKSVLTCSACGNKSTRFEPFSSLQLPIANRERKAANALDITAVVHFSDSPRLRRPRRVVVPAMNDWTVLDLLQKIGRDHLTTSKQHILVAVATHGSLIQDIYDEDMLLLTVPLPIHVLELDSTGTCSIQTPIDPYGSVPRPEPSPGSDVLVKMSSDRLVKGVVTSVHARSRSTPSRVDVLVTEGMANGRTVRHTTDVVAKASAVMSRPVYLRFVHRRRVLAPFYCTTPARLAVSGDPFMVRVPAVSLTGSALYNLVSRRFFGRSVSGSPRRSMTATTGTSVRRFVLRRVSDDGSSCGRCHWMHNCTGCLIDELSAEFLPLEMDETIAVDWVEDDVGKLGSLYESVEVEDDESFRSFRTQHSQSIADSLAMLCSEETLEARCSACHRHKPGKEKDQQGESAPCTPHTKQLSVWSVPPVLVLQLKRFELAVGDEGELSWRKLRERVAFPVRGLQLSPFLGQVDGAHGEDSDCSSRCSEALDARVQRGLAYLQDELGLSLDSASRRCSTYDLYAVIQHEGELNSGHYTAVVRPEGADSDAWWLADDASVSRADRAQLSPSATAYVLFYVRRDVAQGERGRLPSAFFPRRPGVDAAPVSPALAQPPLPPRKRLHEHRRHRREEDKAARGGGAAGASDDTSMCAVM